MKIAVLVVVIVIALSAVPSIAQTPAEWRDTLADHLAGTWKVEGKVMGREAHHEVSAEWVLNHQFVRNL